MGKNIACPDYPTVPDTGQSQNRIWAVNMRLPSESGRTLRPIEEQGSY
jgi:hypothetical protein